mgnify:FL=1
MVSGWNLLLCRPARTGTRPAKMYRTRNGGGVHFRGREYAKDPQLRKCLHATSRTMHQDPFGGEV